MKLRYHFIKLIKVLILDGRDGSTMWNLTSSRYDVSSDLVVRTEERNRDLFLFRIQGRLGVDATHAGAYHGATGVQRVVSVGATHAGTYHGATGVQRVVSVGATHAGTYHGAAGSREW